MAANEAKYREKVNLVKPFTPSANYLLPKRKPP